MTGVAGEAEARAQVVIEELRALGMTKAPASIEALLRLFRERDEALRELTPVVEKLAFYGDALIAREYRERSPAVVALVRSARAALSVVAQDKETP